MLFNSIFNTDDIKINYFNKKSLLVTIIITILLITIFFIKKGLYYENIITISDNSTIIIVDKNMVNAIKESKSLIINDISSDYSINKIMNESNICYIDINLEASITNIQNMKYKIYLGKETIFEYLIRIIKKA